MRVSKDVMARNHHAIIATTTRLLRLQGIERTGVNDLMQACGLTHGGFYRHFASKDALVAEAIRMAFQEISGHFEQIKAKSGPQSALDAYIDQYLSHAHIKGRDFGCPVAAYGAEATRETPEIQKAMTDGIALLQNFISDGLSGERVSREDRANAILSILVGALVTARTAKNSSAAASILKATRPAIELLRHNVPDNAVAKVGQIN